jgi:hypothetical protein
MKATCFFIFLGVMASCDTPQKETKEQGDPQNDTTANSSTACYQYANQSDTVSLKLIRTGESVTGTLVYQLKEKDSNKGTIQGSMKGDLLLADYTFMSEGIQSTRQVAFKQNGNTFIEGYGESIDQNGTLKFKNVDSLNFSAAFKLQEIPCP